MKIQDIETFIVHPPQTKNWVFVKITTDNGIVGWGEAYTQLDRDTAITAHIEEMKRYLIGRDPMQIGHFRHWAYEDMFLKRGSMDVYSAVSGLEIAMWDVTGKALDQPVYNLLGGAVRPALRVYGGGAAGNTPEECANSALKSVKLGYDALKFDPFPGPWRSFVDHADLELAAAKVGAVREAVGPRVEILVEVHRRLSPVEAIMVGRMIEKFRPYWFEEPCPPENIRGIAEVKNALNIPVTIGEAIYGRRGFVEVFERRAADYLKPRHLEHGRNTRNRADRRDGRGVRHGHFATRRQQRGDLFRGRCAGVRRHTELPDVRIPPRPAGRVQQADGEAACAGPGLRGVAHRAGDRHRNQRGGAERVHIRPTRAPVSQDRRGRTGIPQGRRLAPARGLRARVTGSSSIATFMPRLSGWRLPFCPCLTT